MKQPRRSKKLLLLSNHPCSAKSGRPCKEDDTPRRPQACHTMEPSVFNEGFNEGFNVIRRIETTKLYVYIYIPGPRKGWFLDGKCIVRGIHKPPFPWSWYISYIHVSPNECSVHPNLLRTSCLFCGCNCARYFDVVVLYTHTYSDSHTG